MLHDPVRLERPHGLRRLPCIGCDGMIDLDHDAYVLNGQPLDDVRQCRRCLVRYSLECLERTHPEVWTYVAKNRLACFACAGDLYTPVLYQGENGMPVVCPDHGPHGWVA